MKRISLLSILFLFVLNACGGETPVEITDDVSDQKTSIQFDESIYPILLPYKSGIASTYVTAKSNALNRVDIQNIEKGMMVYAKTRHSTLDHIFSEGQYITSDLIREYVKDANEAELGLNPSSEELFTEDEIPVDNIVLFLTEHDYLINSNNTYIIDGMTIALIMDQTPTFEYNGVDMTVTLTDNEMRDFAKKTNEKLISQLREVKGLERVQIQVLNYIVETDKTLIPGRYFFESFSDRTDNLITKNLSEQMFLVPSNEFNDSYPDMQEAFNLMLSDIGEAYPTYVSTIGYLKRMENTVTNLDFTVNVTFTSQSKLYSIAQIYTELVQNYFPGNYELTVMIYSPEKCEIILKRETGETEIKMITLN